MTKWLRIQKASETLFVSSAETLGPEEHRLGGPWAAVSASYGALYDFLDPPTDVQEGRDLLGFRSSNRTVHDRLIGDRESREADRGGREGGKEAGRE